MDVSIATYTLNSSYARNSQNLESKSSGFLIRVFSEEYACYGYSDCHPHPNLGDPPWTKQLESLKATRSLDLVHRSLVLAEKDARARSEGASLYSNDQPLTCYQHIDEASGLSLYAEGFVPLKLKLGFDWAKEASVINRFCEESSKKLRLDFNAKLKANEFLQFLNKLSHRARKQIEYIEDPSPFDPSLWAEWNNFIPLAIDNEITNLRWSQLESKQAFSYMVIKPAKFDPEFLITEALLRNIKFVFSHYMDHPLGVRHAISEAQSHSHHLLFDAYHGLCPAQWQLKNWSDNKNTLSWSEPGIGYEKELLEMEWTKIL